MKLMTVLKLSLLWSLVFLGMCLVAKKAHSVQVDGNSGPMAQRVFQSGGCCRTPFSIMLGTVSSVDLYGVTDGSGTFSLGVSSIPSANWVFNPMDHKTTEITNPSTNYCIFYATWSGFQDSDKYGVIPPSNVSTQTFVIADHQRLFIRYQNSGSSQPVRGVVRY